MRRMLIIGMFALLVTVGMACGGSAPTPTTAPPPLPTTPPPPLPTTPPPPPQACEAPTMEISVNADALQFDTDQLQVTVGTEVVLCFKNVSGVNQHNWVMVRNGTKDAVIERGIQHPENGWVQPDDPDVIAHSKLLDPGETGGVHFTAPEAGAYQFVCTFPGHGFTMFGDIVVTQLISQITLAAWTALNRSQHP